MKPTQTYNDGLCRVYSVTNSAERGKKPVPLLTLKYDRIRYARRTVGINRFWAAKQQGAEISQLLRMPRLPDVSTQDVVILEDGRQYSIRQVQYPEEVLPPAMDLSLERRTERYDLA